MRVTKPLRPVAECIGSATEPPWIQGPTPWPGTLTDMNGWSDDTEQRRLSEPPLPPELSPRRAAATAGGVPPQAARRPQPGGGPGGPGGYGPPQTGQSVGGGPRRPRWSVRKKIGYTALGLVV